MADERSVKIPEHTILSRLGRGGMASVYLARHDRLGRLVAVKVIDDRFDEDSHFRQRFEREARTAAGLTHPNIVPVHEYGFTDDGRPFLTMAFLEGGSLRDRLQKRGPMSVEDALAVTRQVAAALLIAHGRNIVHRDLKPDNVLFQGDTALLTDFGIAKVLDASTALTGLGTNPGTVKYFSPEQAKEAPIDQRSDIYTLGVVLYEMLTGHMPIDGDTVMQLILGIAQKPPDPLPPQLRGLQPFLDALLAKDPADRIASCADVIAIIQAMERNWLRYGDVDRLTDGVSMTSTVGRQAPAAAHISDTDATLLAPTVPPIGSASSEGPLHDGLTTPMQPKATDEAPLHDGLTMPMQPAARVAPSEPTAPHQTRPAFQATPPPVQTTPPPQAYATPAPVATPPPIAVAPTPPPLAATPPPVPAPTPPPIAAAPPPYVAPAPTPALPANNVVRPDSNRTLLWAGIGTVGVGGVLLGALVFGGRDEPEPVTPRAEPTPAVVTASSAATPSVASDEAVVEPAPASEVEEVREEPRVVEPTPPPTPEPVVVARAEPPPPPSLRPPEPRGAPPRSAIVGTWEFRGTEFGEAMHVIWQANADGSAQYLLNPGKKNVLKVQGTWSYSDGKLTEKFGNGGFGTGEIRMISNDEMALRIVENGDARYRGLERRYRRQR